MYSESNGIPPMSGVSTNVAYTVLLPTKFWLVISPDFKIGLRVRPMWLWRFFQYILLGWRWEKADE